jgi:hypothetical protein
MERKQQQQHHQEQSAVPRNEAPETETSRENPSLDQMVSANAKTQIKREKTRPAKRPSVHMVAKRTPQSMTGKTRAQNPRATPPLLVRSKEKQPTLQSNKAKAKKLSVMPAWESMRLEAEQFHKRMHHR